MGLLISKTDFVGVYGLSQSISDTIDPYILKWEKLYLRELMGAELYDLFVASFVGVLPTGDYLTLYNEINQDVCGGLLHSEGMKKMLLGFIWYEYASGTAHKHSDTGIVAGTNEISVQADFSLAYRHYNDSISTYKSIQYYIQKNIRLYPTFKGVPKRLISSL
jgi:hypothetical protein